MPFKSKAQRRFFYAAESRGELPRGTAARWEKETPKGKKLPERKKEASMNEIYELGVANGIEKTAAINPQEFRLLPRFGASMEEDIEQSVKGHKRRAKAKGGYGKEERATAGRYGLGGAALGGGTGALYGAALGADLRRKGATGKGALIGAGAGAALGAGLGALGGYLKGKERTALAKKMEKMSPKQRRSYLREKARDLKHDQMMAAMAMR